MEIRVLRYFLEIARESSCPVRQKHFMFPSPLYRNK